MMLVTLLVVFVGAFGLVLGSYVFISRKRLARQAAARRRIKEAQVLGTGLTLLRDESASSIPMLNEWLKKSSHTVDLQHAIKQAGMSVRPATIILAAITLAFMGLLVGNLQHGMLVGIAYGGLGLFAPYMYLRFKRRRRIENFEAQLPEAMDMLINAMQAGYSYQAAMELVGHEMPEPLGTEFAQFYEEQRLGIDVRSALLSMQDRIPSLDLKMFITAVLIQRETGGNLTEVPSNISRVIRERFRIQGELRTLTAQVRLSGKMLALLPIIVVGGVMLTNPKFIEPLFQEQAGHVILVVAGVSQVVGFILMRKIANIEI
jgi:tight adherence protein B